MHEQLPSGPYSIIYADPPWRYNEGWGNGQVDYPTLTVDDICSLPVESISADEAHLYLWVTNPFLEEGLRICRAWGFEYKTLLTWVKTYRDGTPEMGMGYYFRGCTEHLIFGVRGRLKTRNKTTRNMFQAVNPRRHSAKPESVRDLIVASSGDLPRIELFARERVEGWDCWGNDPQLAP